MKTCFLSHFCQNDICSFRESPVRTGDRAHTEITESRASAFLHFVSRSASILSSGRPFCAGEPDRMHRVSAGRPKRRKTVPEKNGCFRVGIEEKTRVYGKFRPFFRYFGTVVRTKIRGHAQIEVLFGADRSFFLRLKMCI